MMETLELEQRDHPKIYKLSWVNRDGGHTVKKQALVTFEIGEFKDELWCDLLPMDACSLLLGSPCQWDRDDVHHCKQNIYTVAFEEKQIGLQPLPPKYSYAIETKSNKVDSSLNAC